MNYTMFLWWIDFQVLTSLFKEWIKYYLVRLLFLLLFIFSIRFFLETILQAMRFSFLVSMHK